MDNYMDLKCFFEDYSTWEIKENSEVKYIFIELKNFLNSGNEEDAFTVYYSFAEAFHIFEKGYESVETILNSMYKTEKQAGPLLNSQRDHYCHSVYVFAIGLAIYMSNSSIQLDYFNKYGTKDSFIKNWGLISLFHDVGYPLQLIHTELTDYFKSIQDSGFKKMYLSFDQLDEFISLNEEEKNILQERLGITASNINQVLAHILISKYAFGNHLLESYFEEKMLKSEEKDNLHNLNLEANYGFSYSDYINSTVKFKESVLAEYLKKRIVHNFDYIDHGYFSSLMLLKLYLKNPNSIDEYTCDILSAVLVHNDIFRFDDLKGEKIDQAMDPLAYLILLSDDLQSWDRIPFGIVSKNDPLPWKADFFIGNDFVNVCYVYDSIYDFSGNKLKRIKKVENGKELAELYNRFSYYHTKITIGYKEEKKNRVGYKFISNSDYKNMIQYAIECNLRYCSMNPDYEKDFARLPLNYRLSNINLAKSFAQKLEFINCFYSDSEMDYPILHEISRDEFEFLCREEHARWSKDCLKKNTKYGPQKMVEDGVIRNPNVLPYELLSDVSKRYDEVMISGIVPILTQNGTNRIYRYSYGKKMEMNIALLANEGAEAKISDIVKVINSYKKDYKVILWCMLRNNYESQILKHVIELDVTIKTVILGEYDSYLETMKTKEDFDEDLWRSVIACSCVMHKRDTKASQISRFLQKANKLIIASSNEGVEIHSDEIEIEIDGRIYNQRLPEGLLSSDIVEV